MFQLTVLLYLLLLALCLPRLLGLKGRCILKLKDIADGTAGKQRLVLVLGPAKTGSSAMQENLVECINELEERNWHVPSLFGHKIGSKGLSVILLALGLSPDESVQRFMPGKFTWYDTEFGQSPNRVLQTRLLAIKNFSSAEVLRQFRADIQNAYRSGKSVILASEILPTLSVEKLSIFKDIVGGKVALTELVLFYRDPIAHLASVYAQAFKHEDQPPTFSNWMFATMGNKPQIGDSLQRYIDTYTEVFGGEGRGERAIPRNSSSSENDNDDNIINNMATKVTILDFDGLRGQGLNFMDVFACEVLAIPCSARIKDNELRQTNKVWMMQMALRELANRYLHMKGCTGLVLEHTGPSLLQAIEKPYGIPTICSRMGQFDELLVRYDKMVGVLRRSKEYNILYADNTSHPFDGPEGREWCIIDEMKFFESNARRDAFDHFLVSLPGVKDCSSLLSSSSGD